MPQRTDAQTIGKHTRIGSSRERIFHPPSTPVGGLLALKEVSAFSLAGFRMRIHVVNIENETIQSFFQHWPVEGLRNVCQNG